MKKINRKLATISMIACMLNSVNVIAAEERVTIGKVDSYSATAVAVKDHATTEKINSYVLDDGTYVEERSVRSTGTFAENLEKAFSGLDLSVLPSGILLETGALFERGAILQKSGSDEHLDKDNVSTVPFRDMYAGLARAAESSRGIPSLREVQQQSKINFEKHDALPLAISVINYESLDPKAGEDDRLIVRDGKLHSSKGDYWQSHEFLDAGMVSFEPEMNNIYQMVIPSDMFLTNVNIKGKPLSLKSAIISFEGVDKVIKVKPDKPFLIPIGALLNNKNALEMGITLKTNGGEYQVNSEIYFEVNADLAFMSHQGLGSSPMPLPSKPGTSSRPFPSKPGTSPRPFPLKPGISPRPLPVSVLTPDISLKGHFLPYCDIAETIGMTAYAGAHGRLNARVYPASTDINDCYSLNRVLVLVDGFDVMNNRNQASIYSDFSEEILYFANLGYDVVTIDYVKGNDYIQRNGEAFRTFMVDTIPTLMAYMADTTDVAIIAGSMGGQVVNYGLKRAELNGEEHNARLFMTLDTEYEGANIPIGLQLQINFLNDLPNSSSGTQDFVDALKSPAARQLLRHNINSSIGWYAPDPLYDAFRSDMLALGLPQMTRNVSVANGSGTGQWFTNVKTVLTKVYKPGVPFIFIKAETDHTGPVFKGVVAIFGVILGVDSKSINSGAMHDDVRPGSNRATAKQVADAYNSASGNNGTMHVGLTKHSFVPTESATRLGFDYAYYEKCGSQHATMTVGNREVFAKELIAMKNGVLPMHGLPYSQACSQPEPVACTQSVFWWNSWQESDYISPTPYGPYCKIADVPAGATALINYKSFYLESECHPAFINDEVTGKCRVTSDIPPETTYDSVAGELTLYKNESGYGAPSCPYNTVTQFSNFPNSYTGINFNNQYYKVCKVMYWLSPVATVDMVLLAGEGLFTPQTPAEICPIAGKLKKHGCWMGEVPAGVTPVLSGNQFRYSE